MTRGAAALALALVAVGAPAAAQVPVTEVLFSPATSGFESAMRTKVIAFIGEATSTLEIAGFSISDADVIAALNARSAAGVKVRVVTDGSNRAILTGLSGSIQVRDDGANSDEMHHKFIVVDGTSVWTGSANFNIPNFTQLNNNAVIVRNATIAAAYQAEFDRMFNGSFHTAKSGVLAASVTTGGQALEARFAPTDGVANRIIGLLQDADTSIYFAAFTFNHRGSQGSLDGIAKAMADRASFGVVTLRGVFDNGQASGGDDFTKFDELDALEPGPTGNIDVRKVSSAAANDMHHKFIVIDRRIVVTGSFNFTVEADEKNDENVIIITDPAIADRYIQELNRVMGTNWEGLGANDPNVTTVAGAGSGAGLVGDTTTTTTATAGGRVEARAFPNPFRPGIDAAMLFAADSSSVTVREVRIFTLDGRLVRTLRPASTTAVSISWNGRNEAGAAMASGVYIYEMETSAGRLAGRFTLVR